MVNTTTGGGQSSQVIALNSLASQAGGVNSIGPIMKVKNFRLNVVFASSVSVLWALVYVPEGMPVGSLSLSAVPSNTVAKSLYEPQQFLIASGLYSSVASDLGTTAGPLRVWSPLARNLNPGDGIFLVWRSLVSGISGVDTFITINYACCVN